MAFNATYESPSLGGLGRYQAFTDWNFTAAQMRGIGKGYPGQVAPLRGNLYQIVQNRSGGALAVGDSISLYFAAAARIGNLTSASTTSILTTDDTWTAEMSGNDAWPGFIGVTAGTFATTAAEQRRQILANSIAAGASTATIALPDFSDGLVNGAAANSPDVIAAVDNTYDYEAFCPWEVTKTDLDALITSIPQGVVVSTTISDGNFGIAQIAGVCMANVDGTTDLVAGDLLIPDSAAGVLSKWVVTTTDPTTAQVNQGNYLFGRILGAYTANSVGLRMVQMMNRPLYPHAINPG